MTFIEREVCENCGHHFRMKTEEPSEEEKALQRHRTMHFTLPQLAKREPPGLAPDRLQTPLPPMPSASRRSVWPAFALFTLLILSILGLAFFWRKLVPATPAAAVSPMGTWESTLTSRSSANAHLLFRFEGDGTGSFAWQEQGIGAGGPVAGQSPLKWHQDAQGLLALDIAPPATSDPVSGTLVSIFNSHPWLWRVDHPRKRMILGSLTLTEKP